MKGKLFILLIASLILFSDCNPFKNLGKTKDERKTERKQKRARRLVAKAVRIDPSILHSDSIRIPGANIDSSIQVDTSIQFIDNIIDSLLHNLDVIRDSNPRIREFNFETIREWAIKTLKDSIINRDIIKDTIVHKFTENGVEYTFKFWDHNGKILYDFEHGDSVVFYKQIIIKALTVWEKLTWWSKGLFWLFLIILLFLTFKWTYKRLIGYK